MNELEVPNDYQVTVSIKNNLLLNAIAQAGYKSIGEFSEVVGISICTIYRYVDLRVTPYNKKGILKPSMVKICKVLKKLPEDLVPVTHLYRASDTNKVTRTVSQSEVLSIIDTGKSIDELLFEKERTGAILKVLSDLGPKYRRNAEIIKYRMGIGCEAKTLCECGELFNISGGRVREIEMQTLRMLRHPSRVEPLRELL